MALYNKGEIEKAEKIVRGIESAVKNPGFGWREGYRNIMAVDLSCALYVLGHKDCDSQLGWVESHLPLDAYDQADCENRIETICEYLDGWDAEPNGVFDKMLDPDEWIKWSDNTE